MSKVNFSGGVSIDPFPPAAGDSVSITYSGLLAKSGADRVFAHIGYGSGKWSNIKDIEMTRQGEQFVTQIKMESEDVFNVCFKDSANNWDNNSGRNWSARIASRRY
ncbi:MAG: carbohydrate-binding protein [Syntrophomonadaceae bacterium]|nr:carbohydrate-binding protein [Syntrophomonadaceae bacterium]